MADSDMYSVLEATVTRFIDSVKPDSAGSNKTQPEQILSNLSPSCKFDWGHKYFIDSKPSPLQGTKTGQGFVDHMNSMAPNLETWHPEITDTIVDVQKQRVVVRANFNMTVKGQAVVNDIVFLMSMDESGEKLTACTEFIDPAASLEIGRLMKELS